jgi:heat shock protein HslJ
LQIPYGDEQMLSFTAFIPEVPAPLSALNGTHWWLVSMSNLALLSGSEVTADFAINSDGLTGTISGSAGCNTYSAEILGFFQLAPPSSTDKTCSEPAGVMDQESTYLTMLSTANSISLAYNQLLIGTASGLLVYSNSPVPMVPAPTPEPPTATPPAVPTGTPEPAVPTPTATIPLTAIIIPPTEGLVVNTPLLFDGSTSQPTDGSIVQYTWDFGDDSVVPEQAAKVMHTYIAPGTYTVTLTVTNAAGQTNMATVDVTIQ